MATFDVREGNEKEKITEIVFVDTFNAEGNDLTYILSKLSGDGILIEDPDACILIKNKKHAQNLIKALNKAIELGWLK